MKDEQELRLRILNLEKDIGQMRDIQIKYTDMMLLIIKHLIGSENEKEKV